MCCIPPKRVNLHFSELESAGHEGYNSASRGGKLTTKMITSPSALIEIESGAEIISKYKCRCKYPWIPSPNSRACSVGNPGPLASRVCVFVCLCVSFASPVHVDALTTRLVCLETLIEVEKCCAWYQFLHLSNPHGPLLQRTDTHTHIRTCARTRMCAAWKTLQVATLVQPCQGPTSKY